MSASWFRVDCDRPDVIAASDRGMSGPGRAEPPTWRGAFPKEAASGRNDSAAAHTYPPRRIRLSRGSNGSAAADAGPRWADTGPRRRIRIRGGRIRIRGGRIRIRGGRIRVRDGRIRVRGGASFFGHGA